MAIVGSGPHLIWTSCRLPGVLRNMIRRHPGRGLRRDVVGKSKVCTVAALVGIASCSLPSDPPLIPLAGTPVGDDSIEQVVFLIGDAGESPPEGSPLFTRLQEEVEAWSAALSADSAVTVIFLGDNVYPNGVHGPDHPDRARDSLRLANQIDIVRGPEALRHRSTGLFVAGNHDWGGDNGPAGASLIRNEEALITQAAARGATVGLLPPALDPGPEVLDLGRFVRLVAVDTQWWLGNEGTPRRDEALRQITRAVQAPNTRFVLFAAHHPLASGGPHGGNVPFWPSLGAKKLLRLTGAGGQDLSATTYRRMIDDFRGSFASSQASVLYAAGHEHGLQVIQGTTPDDPEWVLVSGAGSKSSKIGDTDGTRFRSSASGFMRLLVRADGTIVIEVVAETPTGFETIFVQPIDRGMGTH
jgi:hypothetical protein